MDTIQRMFTPEELQDTVSGFRYRFYNKIFTKFENAEIDFSQLVRQTENAIPIAFPTMNAAQTNQLMMQLFAAKSLPTQILTGECQLCGSDRQAEGYARMNTTNPGGLPACFQCIAKESVQRHNLTLEMRKES